MLADLVDAVIGVDTHTDTHTAAVVDRLGAHLATIEIRADASGYAQLIAFAISKPPARRSPGRSRDAALTAPAWAAALTTVGHRVIEADRPKKARRPGGKSDLIDAVRAARQALAAPGPVQPPHR
jgi:hypothetical protein